MSPLHMVIRNNQYLQRKERMVHNNFSFTVPLLRLLPATPQHEKAEVLLSALPYIRNTTALFEDTHTPPARPSTKRSFEIKMCTDHW